MLSHSESNETAVLLYLTQEPIGINRAHIDLTGSVETALMLSVACEASECLDSSHGGWLELTQEQWQDRTSLSRYKQEAARSKLIQLGLIEERRAGLPARLQIRVRTQTLFERVQTLAQAMFPSRNVA